jgi:ribosome-binding protein aMBF1 (putative translation factor)
MLNRRGIPAESIELALALALSGSRDHPQHSLPRRPSGEQQVSQENRMNDTPWNGTPAELESTLGQRMKESLNASGNSAGDMSSYLKVHRNNIASYLADRMQPSPTALRAWAAKTGVSLAWLTTGSRLD